MPHTRQTHTATFHSNAAPRHTYVVSSRGHHNGRTVYDTRDRPNHYHPHHEYGPHQVGYYAYDSKPRRAHSVGSVWRRCSRCTVIFTDGVRFDVEKARQLVHAFVLLWWWWTLAIA